MLVRVVIKKHKEVLDTEGRVIMNSLQLQGFDKLKGVTKGSVVDLDLDAANEQEAKDYVSKMCDSLLVNEVIEDYEFSIIS